MKILVSGASGLVGSALVPVLVARGHTVVRLVRSAAQAGEGAVVWDPLGEKLEAGDVEGFDAVVHLAGEGIATKRWTEEQKALIRDSRVKGSGIIARTLAGLASPPAVLVCASAVGYYGDRGDEILVEESPPGKGFLADTCRMWEEASQPAADKGIRVVRLRIGVVLSGKGGALKLMLPPFQLGLGGPLGAGRHYMSWISLEDLVGVIECAITDKRLSGPVNAVAPNPVTNLEFTRILGEVLRRPTIFPVPPFALRLMFGQMADEVLLASQRVVPNKLMGIDYSFRHRAVEAALRSALGRN
ncbi:MAG TPA: TIGR01777 family oxidoreductase [Candidatus Obscuribacterales bacterium]